MARTVTKSTKEEDIMQPQIEFSNIVKSQIASLGLTGWNGLAAIPTSGGIGMELLAGYNSDIFLNKQADKIIPILFQSKKKTQQEAMSDLYVIGNYLQGLKEYPNGTTFIYNNAEVSTEPVFIEKDTNGYYLYSCVIDFKIYF